MYIEIGWVGLRSAARHLIINLRNAFWICCLLGIGVLEGFYSSPGNALQLTRIFAIFPLISSALTSLKNSVLRFFVMWGKYLFSIISYNATIFLILTWDNVDLSVYCFSILPYILLQNSSIVMLSLIEELWRKQRTFSRPPWRVLRIVAFSSLDASSNWSKYYSILTLSCFSN